MGLTIRIGDSAVGLIGLEAALTRLEQSLRDHGGLESLSPEEAGKRLLAALESRNYIPESRRQAYIDALAGLWRRRVGAAATAESRVLEIRILGPGCISCDKLEAIVTTVLHKHGIPADIEHVRELDEIWRYGVISTPALVINGRVLCSGRLPSPAQVDNWVQELVSNI